MGLNELLGEELLGQVQARLGDKRLGVINDGSWVPKSKLDEINEERKQYKSQAEELQEQLGGLQAKFADNAEVTAKVEALRQQIADKEAELAATRKASTIRLQVLQAQPIDVADILPHIKTDSVTVAEDGTITGLEEQVKKLQESKPYLFKASLPGGTGGSLGNAPKVGAERPVDGLAGALSAHYRQE